MDVKNSLEVLDLVRAAGIQAKEIMADGKVTLLDLPKLAPLINPCLLYTSPSPRDGATSRMPSSA